MKIDIDLKEKNRAAAVDILNRLLADEHVLYIKTRGFHWNVTGQNFSELHKFFESQYDELEGIIDEVAERARALGGQARGSMKDFLKITRLREAAGDSLAAPKMLAALLADHEAVIRVLRKDITVCGDELKDAGTNDFLTGLMEQHEKMAWMLRASL